MKTCFPLRSCCHDYSEVYQIVFDIVNQGRTIGEPRMLLSLGYNPCFKNQMFRIED